MHAAQLFTQKAFPVICLSQIKRSSHLEALSFLLKSKDLYILTCQSDHFGRMIEKRTSEIVRKIIQILAHLPLHLVII